MGLLLLEGAVLFIELLFERFAPGFLLLHFRQLLLVESDLRSGFIDRAGAREKLPAGILGLDDQRVERCFSDLWGLWRTVAEFEFCIVIGQLQQGDADVVIGARLADILFRQVEAVEPMGGDDFDLALQADRLRLVLDIGIKAFDERIRHGQVIGIGQVGARRTQLNAGIGFRPFRLESDDAFVAQRDRLPFQAMGKQKRRRNAEVERKHGLKVGEVVGAGVFMQHEQAVDVGVDQCLRRGVVLEDGEGVFTVFGLHRFAVELELRPFEQQQRAAKFGHGVLEFRVLDRIQRLFELRSFLLQADLALFIARRAGAQQQRQADSGTG
ncbi:hypothetical protein D3C87_1192160 [compost metagenome]